MRGRSEHVLKDGFAIVLPNEVHEVESSEDAEFWIGIFSEDYVHEFTKLQAKKIGLRSTFTCSPDILALVRDRLIFAEHPSEYMTKACLYALCDEYITGCEFVLRTDKQFNVMTRIVDYVESNYTKSITLSALAESIGYDYSYFSKTFTSLFGMSFNEYVNTFRFNRATELLLQTDKPIREIAAESGFGSLRTFNGIFKEIAKISPSEFRANISKEAKQPEKR